MSGNADLYRSARDQLVATIADYDKAVETFAFPELTGTFNWAIDWFDAIARGNDRPALWIVEEDGAETQVSFADMAERSDRVATWLAALGVGKGDRVILMLGNQVELWEAMLGIAKLGAVIMPTTGALGPADLADRIARGGARFVIANASTPTSSRRSKVTTGGSWWARPWRAGTPTPTRPRCSRSGSPVPPRSTTPCSSTSPPAPPASPSWSSIRRSATPSGICRRWRGSA